MTPSSSPSAAANTLPGDPLKGQRPGRGGPGRPRRYPLHRAARPGVAWLGLRAGGAPGRGLPRSDPAAARGRARPVAGRRVRDGVVDAVVVDVPVVVQVGLSMDVVNLS